MAMMPDLRCLRIASATQFSFASGGWFPLRWQGPGRGAAPSSRAPHAHFRNAAPEGHTVSPLRGAIDAVPAHRCGGGAGVGLRSRKLGGLKFRRQHPVGQFTADFACLEASLIVEADGAQDSNHKSNPRLQIRPYSPPRRPSRKGPWCTGSFTGRAGGPRRGGFPSCSGPVGSDTPPDRHYDRSAARCPP